MTAAARETDRLQLMAFLSDLRTSGRPVPCQEARPAIAAGFTSEDDDEQQQAARLCVGCAGATACGRYGTTYPREFGVYGGATNSERRPRKGRPTKTSSKGAAA